MSSPFLERLPPAGLWLGVPALVILVILHGVLTLARRRRARAKLADREQLSAAAFGQRYFGDSAENARLAAFLRDALAQNERRSFDDLRPDDRLWEDLHVDLHVDPHFFWGLEEKLGITLVGENGEKLLELLHSMKTFRDLHDAVRHAAAEGAAAR